MERAGIPLKDEQGRRVDFHSLRMTFGTTMLARGVHPIVVKELMRHSDLKLTTNLYTDSSQLPLAGGVAALPGFPNLSTDMDAKNPGGSTRTQKRTQTWGAEGRRLSSPVVSVHPATVSQPFASVAVRPELTRQDVKIRLG